MTTATEIDITITQVPSYNTARRLTRENVCLLPDRALITKYAKAVAIRNALSRNLAPSDYFNGVCSFAATGKVPKDMWLQTNIDWFVSEAKAELTKRGLMDSFTVWLELN